MDTVPLAIIQTWTYKEKHMCTKNGLKDSNNEN